MKRIISYNVNGIRAAQKKGLLDWMRAAQPDILCLQETKAQPEQIETNLYEELGYHCYYFSAQKKGYSGVAIMSKEKPDHIEYGCGIETGDFEGRIIRADFGDKSVISAYFPSGTTGDIRQDIKMAFLADMQEYLNKLQKTRPNLVVCGDYNICHEAIDIHNPVSNKKSSGFLPEEREWVTQFLASGFVDSFRHLNKEPHNYSWWSYRANARDNNKGWRIDYNMVTKNMEEQIERAAILPEAKHSDHCPILVEMNW
ncbi:MAG: exodeoxyribonuclease-3 [Flavobacteriales bacterium]|jgi:exodeoxyribonuclease-3